MVEGRSVAVCDEASLWAATTRPDACEWHFEPSPRGLRLQSSFFRQLGRLAASVAVLWSWALAYAQDAPLNQYQPPTTIYQAHVGGVYASWDEACYAAMPKNCYGSTNICYSNPRGGFHDQEGQGCYYRVTDSTGADNPNWFGQNWAYPVRRCFTGWTYNSTSGECEKAVTYQKNLSCKYDNPVYPSDGTKDQTEHDFRAYVLGSPFDFTRNFYSDSLVGYSKLFGWGWTVDPWTRSLRLQGRTSPGVILAVRAGGHAHALKSNGAGVWTTTPYSGLELQLSGTEWILVDRKGGTLERYDAAGRLLSLAELGGRSFTMTYSTASTPTTIAPGADYLIGVSSAAAGRDLALAYDASGRLASASMGGVSMTQYGYDAVWAHLLTTARYGDDTVRRYLYEPGLNPMYYWLEQYPDVLAKLTVPAGYPTPSTEKVTRFDSFQGFAGRANTYGLTGMVDENGQRISSYTYDDKGRVTRIGKGSLSTAVTFDYSNPLQTVVTDRLGSVFTRSHTISRGMLVPTSQSQPAGAGCSASTSAQTYDGNGNVASSDDFNGGRTCYASDQQRNLPVTVVEGLSQAHACASVVTAGASIPTGARKITTEWHPDWALSTRRAEPGRLTTLVYNGQPDPFNGNAVASCAPASATMPDGKRIAVLCKRVEQATNDADGSIGLGVVTGGPIAPVVGLLLHANGVHGSTSFVDNSASPKTVAAVGNASISTTQSKFGGASAYFDGAGDYLTVPHHSSLDVSTGDFAIETWVRPTTSTGVYVLMKKGIGSGYAGFMIYLNDGKLVAQANDTGSALAFQLQSTSVLGLNSWSHIALTRSGSTFRLFVNGTLNANSSYGGTLRNALEVTSIGANSVGGYPFNGHIDDVRITKGAARYTENFTPATAQFPDTGDVQSWMDTTVPNRIWTYTYNEHGQVLTAKGPRTDVNDTTTYAYFTTTTADYTIGDLQSVTNAVSKVTSFPLYNKHGQPLRMVDINSVVTDYTYDVRQRLKTVSVGGQTTIYDYHPNGLLKRVTQPDSISFIDYGYDDAQRLTSISDNLGNRIEYTLDNAGNRTAEKVKDPASALSRQLTRVMDALGRVQQTTGRE